MLDEVIGVGESHAPGGGVRVHSSGRAKPGAGLGGVARGERQRNSGIFRWRKRVGGRVEKSQSRMPFTHFYPRAMWTRGWQKNLDSSVLGAPVINGGPIGLVGRRLERG